MQYLDSFADNGWFADGSIDWIDFPYRREVQSLFVENDASSLLGVIMKLKAIISVLMGEIKVISKIMMIVD